MYNKGNIVLLTIIATATLLVAVVGATFAYFGATLSDGESSKTIEVTSGTLTVEYDTNSQINSTTANSGDIIATKNFTVEGALTGSSNLKYDLDLIISSNNYESGELVYILTSKNVSNNGKIISSTTNEVAIPSGKSNVELGVGSFAGPTLDGAKHNYTLVIKYISSSTEPSNKTFNANIKVSQSSN